MSDQKTLFECEVCHRTYSSAQAITQHCRDTHHQPSITCSLCNRQFGSFLSLQQHRQSQKHKQTPSPNQNLQKKRVFVCEFCHKCFQTRDDRNHHFSTCHGIILKNKAIKIYPPTSKESISLLKVNKNKMKNTHKYRTGIIDEPKCPPHKFIITEQAYVGFGPGNANETLHEDGITRCVYCGKTPQRIEFEENNKL